MRYQSFIFNTKTTLVSSLFFIFKDKLAKCLILELKSYFENRIHYFIVKLKGNSAEIPQIWNMS